jgi:hypothetical protein
MQAPFTSSVSSKCQRFIRDLTGSFASASIHAESCDRRDAVARCTQRFERFSQSATQRADYPGGYDRNAGRTTFSV